MKQDSFRRSLTPSFVAKALGLNLPALDQLPAYTAITTDSRKVQEGCLFVALPGEKFDGHDFIPSAIESGARGIICRKDFQVPAAPNVRSFGVDEPIQAFRRLAAAWRKEFQIPLVAVAGSAGKTTSKELLAAILRGKWKSVLKTEGSQNGYVGIPITLMNLNSSHQAAVVEIGIDEIGAMEKHLQIAQPTAALLTSIGPEHLEKLVDVPTVAREEGLALSQTAKSGGLIAVNLDDEWIRPFAKIARGGKSFTFSLRESVSADERSVVGKLDVENSTLAIEGGGSESFSVQLPLMGRHNASNLLGAITIARALGLSAAEIQSGLATFKGADGRSEIQELPGPTPVVCDYYNAQPLSVEAGLDLLTQVARAKGEGKKRHACLGDMLELGSDEEKFHRGLADKITQLGIESVFLYGPRMKCLQDELEKRSYPGELEHFESHEELASSLLKKARPGDALLIKGSRGMKMEEVWKALQRDFGR